MFLNNKESKYKERAHGDGIFINYSSPEALDEIFLKTYSDTELQEFYPDYISLLLYIQSKKRYLSKNNYNYRRLSQLIDIFPNSNFLLLARSPIHHASSLHKQHQNFIKLQKKDKFVLRYMNYLGHYEFGLNHKPWFTPQSYLDPKELNYWLEQWYLFYSNLTKKKLNKNMRYVVYEKLVDQSYIKNLFDFLKLNTDLVDFKNFNNANLKSKDFDNNLLKKSLEIYSEIKSVDNF